MTMESSVKSTDGRACLCGVLIDRLSMPEVVEHVRRAIVDRKRLSISVANVAKVVNMRADTLLRESVCSGDLILADGMPLVWLSRLTGQPLPERVTGIDLMFEIFRQADHEKFRVFFLGAKAETLRKVVEITERAYPGMVITGWRDGYFSDQEQEEVAQAIRAAAPDILLVAMSSPKKELFMKRWSGLMHVPVCHGVGGSFDVMAGVTRRAPPWMQRVGLEWFYRLLQEPRRMWKRYLTTNLAFALLAARCLLCRQVCLNVSRAPCEHAWLEPKNATRSQPASSFDGPISTGFLDDPKPGHTWGQPSVTEPSLRV